MKGYSSLRMIFASKIRLFIPAGLIYFGLYTAWLLLASPADLLRVLVGRLALLFPLLAAALLSFIVSRVNEAERFQRSWRCIAMGLAFWLAGNLIRLGYELFFHNGLPVIPLDDGCLIAGYIFLIWGFTLFLAYPRQRFGLLRFWIEMTISSGAIITLGWLIFIQPILSGISVNPGRAVWGVAYPIMDLVALVITANALLIAGLRRLRASLSLIVLGLTAVLVGDLGYSYLFLHGQYQTGNVLDIGWVLGYLLISIGAVIQLSDSNQGSVPQSRVSIKTIRRTQAVLPFAATLALVWYSLVSWQMNGNLPPQALWISIALIVVLIADQGIRAGEYELREYACLLDNAAEPAFICDMKGQIKLANPALKKALGISPEEILSDKKIIDFIAEVTNQDGKLNPAVSEGWSGEVQVRRANGPSFPAYLSLRPIAREEVGFQALAGTFYDLTEQKRQQQALQEAYKQVALARQNLAVLNEQLEERVAEKTERLSQAYQQLAEQHQTLQSLDQLKSDFISLVSHELRAPLTNVSGGIELVLQGQHKISPQAGRSLELVQAEIRRLSHFVETILDLSALEAGKMPFYSVPVQLEGIISDLQKQFTSVAGAERLSWEIPSHLPYLMADERALTSILFHLIDNALKYAPKGEIKISAFNDNGKVSVSVSDRGPGISQDQIPLLFEKFQRLNSGDAQTVYGHGLGLYIARRLLQSMAGDIQMKNLPEGGACFEFWLPSVEDSDEE
jgi:PAS domain S-box-containing protein